MAHIQEIIALSIVVGVVGWLLWRSRRAAKRSDSGCGTGCGSCAGSTTKCEPSTTAEIRFDR